MDNQHILYTLKEANPKLRKVMLQNVKNDTIKALSEICHNTIKGNVEIGCKQKKCLKRYKTSLRSLARRSLPLTVKRKILIQKGGFLPTLLTVILSSVIGAYLKKQTS